MNDEVRRIKERLDLVEVVGDYVKLRKAGKSFVGLCPFHQEKTPSFSVSRERQTYHCFGCGVGGDVFRFLMEMEGWTFPQALEVLSARTGVPLEHRGRRREEGGDVLEEALAFYRASLGASEGEAARAYLRRRELPQEAWERFELGWSLPAWRSLEDHLRRQGLNLRDAVERGLLVEGPKGTYDRFRGRVMFPIRSETGRLLGFGGRLVDGEGAKYVNSPESPLFEKRKILYLLPQAKRAIREKGSALVVEGYLDAIRCHLNGHPEAVASLGTAFTEEQADLLARQADRCLICFDTDAAGQEAALKGMYVLRRKGLDVRVVRLPKGKDPDELLRDPQGAEAFEGALTEALPLPRFHVAARRKWLEDPQERKRGLEEVLGGIASLSVLDVRPSLPDVAADLGLLPHELEALLRQRGWGGVSEKRPPFPPRSGERGEGIFPFPGVSIHEGGEEEPAPDPWEAALCHLLWSREGFRSSSAPEGFLPLLRSECARAVASALLCGESPEELEARWLQAGDQRSAALLALGGAFLEELYLEESPEEEVLRQLRLREWRRRYEELHRRVVRKESLSEDERRDYVAMAAKIKRGEKRSYERKAP
ncbi:DNA primase [Aminomonas paucivorans]|uniref:DNA primase n=1 Tax=Aminomonas paucivorans TaxID=81412 RepID=UPI0033342D20